MNGEKIIRWGMLWYSFLLSHWTTILHLLNEIPNEGPVFIWKDKISLLDRNKVTDTDLHLTYFSLGPKGLDP